MEKHSSLSSAVAPFSWDILLKILKDGKNKENVFLSPLSISFALQLVQKGATNETSQELVDVLHLPKDSSKIAEETQSLLKELKSKDISIDIANGVWIKREFGIKQEFLHIAQKEFHAEIKDIAENSVSDINDWVSKTTHGKIPSIIKKIENECKMVIVNAIYFKALFSHAFDAKNTHEAPFTLANGSTKNCHLMSQKRKFPFLEHKLFHAINLPYSSDERSGVMATVILPNDGPSACFEKLIESIQSSWSEIASSFREDEVQLFLPRFKIEFEMVLNQVLQNLGLKKSFSDSAQFDGMTPNPVGLKIGEVLHKAFVEVDEKGTEAAAATAVKMMARCAVVQKAQPKVMRVDRPFLFLIRQHDLILFAGVITSV